MNASAPSKLFVWPRSLWSVLTMAVVLALSEGFGLAQIPLVQRGAPWRYLDNGSDQGTDWRKVGFNDEEWRGGIGQFGYGEDDEATLINPGPNLQPFVTTYFRHVFLARV